MSKATKTAVTAFFLLLVQKIFRGRPVPTIIGGVAGAAIGSTAGMLHNTLLAAGAFFGLVAGSAILAAIFPRPPAGPTAPDTDESQIKP